MRKVLTIVMVAVLLFAIGTVGVFAAKGSFADENNDGICDNRPVQVSENKGTGYIDGDEDGVCDNFTEKKPAENCKGEGFVDEDEDGVCDNFTDGKNAGECQGRNKGTNCQGQGRGKCLRQGR